MRYRVKNAFYVVAFFALCIALLMTGCASEQVGQAADSVNRATTQPILEAVAGTIPYGTEILTIVSFISGVIARHFLAKRKPKPTAVEQAQAE
jgi:hypothetical protein